MRSNLALSDSAIRLDTGLDVRLAARSGGLDAPTAGMAPGFVQGNLTILPHAYAEEFLRFCQANPKPCPLLDVTEPGSPEPRFVAPGADLRTDLPRYRVYRGGGPVEEGGHGDRGAGSG